MVEKRRQWQTERERNDSSDVGFGDCPVAAARERLFRNYSLAAGKEATVNTEITLPVCVVEERSILGAILENNAEAFDIAAQHGLVPEDFSSDDLFRFGRDG